MERKTSIIILTYNQLNYTKQCIESIRKYTEKETYELILVDNASTDGTKEWLKQQKDIKFKDNMENVGFPKGCNQGIQMAEKENDILLLNNDTIVTTNWLRNLKICLESDSKIGAVGPICNQNENRQGASFSYSDFETMQLLAKENNVSCSEKWEEKAFLIGYCLLIKREVIQILGQLDEGYSPGYVEDNDLSLRILKQGYRLMLCHDSFIHHYLGTAFRKDLSKFYPILYKNRDYFFQKWHFKTEAFDALKEASFKLITSPCEVLEFSCGIGVTMLALKYRYKNIEIEGIEEDSSMRIFGEHFGKVYSSFFEVKDKKYDTILIGNLLEQIPYPKDFLTQLKGYLKPNGVIIGEIYNTTCIRNLNQFLYDEPIKHYENQIHFFTRTSLERLVKELGFPRCSFFSWYEEYSQEEKELLANMGHSNPYFNYTYYTFRIETKDQ